MSAGAATTPIRVHPRAARGAEALEHGLALCAAALIALPLPVGTPLRRATIPLILLAGALALGRRSGALAALRVAAVAGAVGLALEVVAVAAGTFQHRDAAVLRFWVPLAWAAFAFPAVALAAARTRSRAVRSACGSAALVSLALLWDPLGLHAGAFTWPGGGSYAAGVVGFDGSRGIPAGSFSGWVIVGACAALASGTPREGAPATLPPLHALLFAALAWRVLDAGIDGVLLPAAAAAALALLLARWRRAR